MMNNLITLVVVVLAQINDIVPVYITRITPHGYYYRAMEQPRSEVQCRRLKVPKHGYMHYVGLWPDLSTNVGTEVEFTCDPGYQLSGAGGLSCEISGLWYDGLSPGKEPTCKLKSCLPLSTPLNGNLHPTDVRKYTTIAHFSCKPMHVLMGNRDLMCQGNGLWTTPPPGPECLPLSALNMADGCVEPPLSPLDGTMYPENKFTIGTVVVFACNAGFTLYGPRRTRCLINGEWSVASPNCFATPQCEVLEPEEFGTFFPMGQHTYGSTARYSCFAGYHVEGCQTIRCNPSGEWSCPEPDCEDLPYCLNQVPPTFGSVHPLVGHTPGVQVVFECNAGYMLVGSKYLKCHPAYGGSSLWNGTAPTCSKVPDQPPTQASVSCEEYVEPMDGTIHPPTGHVANLTVMFSCNAGFVLMGEVYVRCLNNGTWSHPPPTCVAVKDCPAVELTHGSAFPADPHAPHHTNPGTTLMFSCDAGYTIRGPKYVTCKHNGKWDERLPYCDKDPICTTLLPPKHGSMYPMAKRGIGTAIIFECDAGYKLVGEKSITCQPPIVDPGPAWWDGLVPRCGYVDIHMPRYKSIGSYEAWRRPYIHPAAAYGASLTSFAEWEAQYKAQNATSNANNSSGITTLPGTVRISNVFDSLSKQLQGTQLVMNKFSQHVDRVFGNILGGNGSVPV